MSTYDNESNMRISLILLQDAFAKNKRDFEVTRRPSTSTENRQKSKMERVVRCFSDEAVPPRKIPNPTKIDAISRIDSLQSNQHGIAYIIPPYIMGEFLESRPNGERAGMEPSFFPFEGKRQLRDALKISLQEDMDCVLCMETLRRSPQGNYKNK